MSKPAIAVAVVALIGGVWLVRSLQADEPDPVPISGNAAATEHSESQKRSGAGVVAVEAKGAAANNGKGSAGPRKAPNTPPLSRWAPTGKGRLVLPGGTAVAALNGVVEEIELLWPENRPWSPIISTELNGGLQWYVHADGSKSTTQMLFRSDLGRETAISLVQNPMKAAPTQFDK